MLYRMIRLPPQVNLTKKDGVLIVEGPEGQRFLSSKLQFLQKGQTLFLFSPFTSSELRDVLQASLGVGLSYSKELVLDGVGYRVRKEKSFLILDIGYSHSIHIVLPVTIFVECLKNKIFLKSCNLQELNNFCTHLRSFRFPDSYKAKGILYKGEILKKKEGKT
ncbi:unnamed protein product [Discosporangium mesarthrocarpum]